MKLKRVLSIVLTLALLLGMYPSEVHAENAETVTMETIVETTEESTEANTEAVTETTEEITTEAVTEVTTENPVEESTTEKAAECTTAENTINEVNLDELEFPQLPAEPETEAQESEEKQQTQNTKMMQLAASSAKTVYSDGTWSGGIIWYVPDGSKKHYVFCLDKGKTMYSGKYSGSITSGFSGATAFRIAVALQYFKSVNGGWNGKSEYGTVQKVIWNETDTAASKALMQYINHAWKLASNNGSRSSGSSSYSSILKLVSQSNASTASGRKTIAKSITNKIEMDTENGVCSGTISLSGTAWKYFAKGDMPGITQSGFGDASACISVVGLYDMDGKAVSSTGSNYVDRSGKLHVEFQPETGKGDGENPLTVIMKVQFPYQGANSINYLNCGANKQRLAYESSASSSAYFALQVYGDSDSPDKEKAKVYINKVDEFGEFVPGCTFRLTGTSGEALAKKVELSQVFNREGKYFEIEYPGTYEIVETAVPSSEYKINPTVYTFTAVEEVNPDTGETEITLRDINADKDDNGNLTYTMTNYFAAGGAELTKYGSVLAGYEDGQFIYEKRILEGVSFDFYAAEDIYCNETLVFKEGTKITNGMHWGAANSILGSEIWTHTVYISSSNTDADGKIVIDDLPTGGYYAVETRTLQGFAKEDKSYRFSIQGDKTTQINGTDGIINEQAPAVCHVYKVDNDTNKALGGGEFTIYADVSNTNYDGKAIFGKASTVPVVTGRNLATGEESIEEGVWVPIQQITTGTDGMAEFDDLPVGRYLVAETKAPDGYELAEETYIFTHSYENEQSASGYNFEHTFKDEKIRNYRILKNAERAVPADPEEENLDVYFYEEEPGTGAEFGIYSAEDIYNTLGNKVYSADTLITTCTTDENGIASFNGSLFAGQYYFKEIKTPDDSRYILDDKKYSFTVSGEQTGGILNEEPIVNKLYKGSIKVIKTDGKTEVPLSDVMFDLLDGNKKEVLGTFVTDDNGEINIKDLPVGTYYLQETETQKGYKLDDSLVEITITRDDLDKVVNLKNYNSETDITVKTNTTVKGSGGVRTGDMGPVGIILALLLISSFCFVLLLKKKGVLSKVSVKGKKFLFILGMMIGTTIVGSLTAKAAAELKEISAVEIQNVEHNGRIYTYALQKQYETSDPDQEVTFEEKLDGLKLEDVEYELLDTILQTKTLEESKEYTDLLEKDESVVPKAIDVDGETYNLENITWSEEPNIEHVSYTQDYGYATSEPEHAATYEYTYISPVTNEENTVTLPFVRMEKGEYKWVDGFTATVTFKNLDGVYFKLGSHEFAYNPNKLSLSESDFTELVKMLGYDTSKYRLTSAAWSGKAYKAKNGELYRDAKASGQQYAASFQAVYEDDVENGKIYTAHAAYTCEVEVPAEEAAPTYVRQATGYYQDAGVWTNIITFVTGHKAVSAIALGIIFVFIVLIIAIIIVNKKKKKALDIGEETSKKEGING